MQQYNVFKMVLAILASVTGLQLLAVHMQQLTIHNCTYSAWNMTHAWHVDYISSGPGSLNCTRFLKKI